MEKTIDPTTHIALDYGLAATQIIGPELLGLGVRANAVGTLFGLAYGATAALTDTPLGITRAIPFSTHGAMELPSIAAMVVVPWLTGASKRPVAKIFFLSCVGMALMSYLKTDFSAQPESEDLGVADVSDAAEEALEPLLRT